LQTYQTNHLYSSQKKGDETGDQPLKQPLYYAGQLGAMIARTLETMEGTATIIRGNDKAQREEALYQEYRVKSWKSMCRKNVNHLKLLKML